ncbi:hypothetical protein Tco_1109681 [Tanacetum coccineum]
MSLAISCSGLRWTPSQLFEIIVSKEVSTFLFLVFEEVLRLLLVDAFSTLVEDDGLMSVQMICEIFEGLINKDLDIVQTKPKQQAIIGDIVKIVSTVVRSRTAGEFSVAGTALGIMDSSLVGHGPSKMAFLMASTVWSLNQCILRNMSVIEHIFLLQALVDDPLIQLP